jgi:excisionase family DNA binding protein
MSKMYPLKEAAAMMGFAPSTVRDKIRAGKIAAVQDGKGGRVMISEAEIKRVNAERHSGIEPQAPKPPSMPAPVFQVIDKTKATQIKEATQPATAAQPAKQPEREYYSIGGL